MIPSCCYTNKSVQCFNPCYVQCASRSVTYSNPCSPCTYTYECTPCAPARKSCLRVCSLPRQYSSCTYEADECPKRRSSTRLSSVGLGSSPPPAPRQPRAKSKKRTSTTSERKPPPKEIKKSEKPKGGGKLKVTSEGKVKITGGKGGTKVDATSKCEVSRENPAHPSKNVNVSTEDGVNVVTATDDEAVDIGTKAQIELDGTGIAEDNAKTEKHGKSRVSRGSITDKPHKNPEKCPSKTKQNTSKKQSRASGSNSRIEVRTHSKVSQTGSHPAASSTPPSVRAQNSGNVHTLYPPTQQNGYGGQYPPSGGYPPQMGYPPQNGYHPQNGYPPQANYGYPPGPPPCPRPLTQTNFPPVCTPNNMGVIRPNQCYCEEGSGKDKSCNVVNCPYVDGDAANDELCISILLKMDQKTFDSLMDLGCSLTPNLKFCKTCGAIKVDPVVIPITSTKGEGPELKTCKVECKANCSNCPSNCPKNKA